MDRLSDMRVSVVVPAYNRAKTILRCIESIIKQTIPAYEIIVVDDGSTDRTVEILESMNYENLRIIKQNHRGAQAARNLGIINSRGEYIAFLDSDDEWLPWMLEESLAVIEKHSDCVVYSNGYKCFHNRKHLLKNPRCQGDAYQFILHCGGPMFQGILMKRQLLLQIGLLDENVVAYQEKDMAIQLALLGVEFIHINKPLFIWHWHDGETISKDTEKGIRGALYIVEKNKNESIKRFGLKDLNEQYIKVLKMCVKSKSITVVLVISKMLISNVRYVMAESRIYTRRR